MKLNKLTILIAISLIATLVLVIVVRENQHDKTIADYLDREILKEQDRLETYREFTKNYNELQDNYDELYKKYEEHIEYIWQTFTITGYSVNDPQQGTNNIVATTFNLDYTRVKDLPIVASNCIPLYTLIEIRGLGGFIVLDNGLGYWASDHWEDNNWIDILFDSKDEALEFGVKELEVRVIR